jgi:hypothetical protein
MARRMLPGPALTILVVLGAATLLWSGDKRWNEKRYQEWDAKDIQQIMSHSPWVATTSMRRSWHPFRRNLALVPVQPEMGMPAVGAMGTGPNASRGVTPRGSREGLQQVEVYVYWLSSRVMRAASAREGVLRGTLNASVAEKLVDAPQSEYEIVLRMDDMAPFVDQDANFYRQNSFLRMRRSKLKVPPSKVVYEHMGTISEYVVFLFPKRTAGGAPTIASDETDVEFGCRIADQSVRVKFKPKKMVDQFGTDL